MRVRYDPNKNLEVRALRDLLAGRDEMMAGEACADLGIGLQDFGELLGRLGDIGLVDSSVWPVRVDSSIFLTENDLIPGKEYEVLLVAFGSYRILSEGTRGACECEPYQFHRELFSIIDSRIPDGWRVHWLGGDLSIHPPCWDNSLFCRFFERREEGRARFVTGLRKYFPETYQRWQERQGESQGSNGDM